MNLRYVYFGLILLGVSLVFMFLFFEANKAELDLPSWKSYALDMQAPSRFLDLIYDSKNNPHIFYYAERTGGGVKHAYSENTVKDFYKMGRNWKEEQINKELTLGFFISADIDYKDTVHLSFMNYQIGRDRLFYYNTSAKEQVLIDSIRVSGIGTGVYSVVVFVDGKGPYVFYHVDQGRKFMMARPGEEPVLLETETGVNTAGVAYGSKIFLAHRGRDDLKLRLSSYDTKTGEWKTEFRDITANAMGVGIFKERPYVVFYNYDDKGIYFSFFEDEVPKKIADGYESRISTDASEEGIYVSFNRRKEGLFVLKSDDANAFEEVLFVEGANAGIFSSIKVTENNDIKVAYLDGETLKYDEFERSSYLYHSNLRETKKMIFMGLFIIFISLCVMCFGISFFKES
ncbi:MAG TPA: hypothetical protein ENN46_01880 [Candidatus Woesearchaeota archaeon]|nr:hypothetical protein [Candidatus Woesearchaeota archaeon]